MQSTEIAQLIVLLTMSFLTAIALVRMFYNGDGNDL